ncbi:MAG: hypothetical protein IT326_09805 [Anaerolineae bacterium]|nr:hypothetical protein [Anaerolineae bacterium]
MRSRDDEIDRAIRRERQRTSTTRFDRTRRNVTIAVILLLVVAGAGLAQALGAFGGLIPGIGSLLSRADPRPRYIDIWSIYPDGSVRYTALFTPMRGTPDGLVDVAGPILLRAEDEVGGVALGAELLGKGLIEAPTTGEQPQVYHQYSLRYSGKGQPYGIDVRAQNSPYVTALADGVTSAVVLGTQSGGGFYQQVIVAVAIPADATDVVVALEQMQAYQMVNLDQWTVFYFDTTSVPDGSLIRVQYVTGASTPLDLDYQQVARRR